MEHKLHRQKDSRVPEVSLLQYLHGNSRRTIWAFSTIVKRP